MTQRDERRPSGRAAFLFTDLQGSTRAWERAPEAMNDVLTAHDRILRTAISDNGGVIFSTAGDAFGAAFHTSEAALRVAVAVQRELHVGAWPEGLEPQVRMGIHVGSSFERDESYFGPTLNRAARLMHAAHGGQVVVSNDVVQELGSLPEGVSLRDLGSFVLADIGDPVGIWQVVIDGLRAGFPPLDTVGPPPPRVPRYHTSFVDRTDELARLKSVLTDRNLVTLVAAGGTGKTRLAYKTAVEVADAFPDGVFAIELADGDADQVEKRAAEAVLGEVPLARTERAADPLGALLEHLAKRRAILVVDNCEHVMQPVRRLIGRITQTCPRTAILATSREVVGLPGEVVVSLSPLDHAPSDSGTPPAVQLFIERALSANEGIAFDDDELQAVERLCERLEGLPLGLELAASRVRTLAPTEILARLEESMAVLHTRAVAPERQRSLEGAIWWSWNLLDDAEQLLLARTSVFVGGFSLDAIQTVGGASDAEVLDRLESLVDKSLVTHEGKGRYRLAEPIRQFALARLDELGGVDDAHAAHFKHFSRLARSVVRDLDTRPDPTLVGALVKDHDNFIAAIERARDRGDLAQAASLTVRMHPYWEETGHLSVGVRMLDSIVGDDPENPAVFPAVALLTTYATMCCELDRAKQLAEPMRRALDLGLPDELAGSLRFNLGFIDLAAGHLGPCVDLWSAAGEQLVEHNPPLARQSSWSAGYAATINGELDRARALFDRAEAIALPKEGWFPPMLVLCRAVVDVLEGAGDVGPIESSFDAVDRFGLRLRTFLGSALSAIALFETGHADRAEPIWRRGIEVVREGGQIWGAWMILEFAAWGADAAGSVPDAALLWGALHEFGSTRGYSRWPIVEAGSRRRRDDARRRDPDAFDRAFATGRSMALHEAVDAALSR